MDFFQSRDDLQIWTMAQGGSAGAEALREVRSPDGNLHWQVLKIIRDSSRLFSCQTVFMFLVKKGDGNRTFFLNLDSTDDQPAARGIP